CDFAPAVPLAGPRNARQDLANEQPRTLVQPRTARAVAAGAARLPCRRIAEVPQNRRSKASGAVRIGDHPAKFLMLDLLAPCDFVRIDGDRGPAGRLVSIAIDQELARLHVGIIPQQRRDGLTAVAAGAADLL